ncbi:hypothetical protein [Nostoc sp. 'Peltigera membranacea cyanobiont' 210A]|uniref:hypothetical protein n=1 Tax=Nostoc sp. 'Peltigera membranacea cyanobiont' 210A TaxID=2014529 RepID=UPI00117E8B4A|nr:hypothetical protein [Nostoc sp. 'Peltigera membranacea cyanobiont' 210A]
MTNTQPTTKRKDPTQQRIEKLERTVNALHHHLLSTLELTYILSTELASAKGRVPSEDGTCTRILAEYNIISSLHPIK